MQNSKVYPLPPKHSAVEAIYRVLDAETGKIHSLAISWENGKYHIDAEELDFIETEPLKVRKTLKRWDAKFQGWQSQSQN